MLQGVFHIKGNTLELFKG